MSDEVTVDMLNKQALELAKEPFPNVIAVSNEAWLMARVHDLELIVADHTAEISNLERNLDRLIRKVGRNE